jgi:hypothetical protein
VSKLESLAGHYITAQAHRKIAVMMNNGHFTNQLHIKIVNNLNYLEILLTDWAS